MDETRTDFDEAVDKLFAPHDPNDPKHEEAYAAHAAKVQARLDGPYLIEGDEPMKLPEGGKIIWQGRQWLVTDWGIKRRDGGYTMSFSDACLFFDWEVQKGRAGFFRKMAGRSVQGRPVDLNDFVAAMSVARYYAADLWPDRCGFP